MKLEQILAFLRQLRRLPAVYYIGGSEILPPPLSPEEEAAAAAACQAGDEGARRTLIEHNLRLVVFLARKFESSGVGTEDLISIGTIGLIKAVSTYRSDRKVKLATYASRCIENEILMYLRKIAGRRAEVSFDEPLSSDWDGNELLLSDILGTEPDSVMAPARGRCRPCAAAARAFPAAAARAADHLHALRHRPARGHDAEGGCRPPRHLAKLYLPS